MLVGVGGLFESIPIITSPFASTSMLTIAESAHKLYTRKEIPSKWSMIATYTASTHIALTAVPTSPASQISTSIPSYSSAIIL
ncbi:hypothetical protein GJ744_008206 [Endocarpon pusillum]|uniref:Uncharacterized protein n=1 Tax=Endocarpon pusillum TaxID=364733 RepID=A0A8H7AJW9_9EURO|nr:hypothetical protein GJ744_008206 [Endocarpon pusillum]